jgi:hypothetical protein
MGVTNPHLIGKKEPKTQRRKGQNMKIVFYCITIIFLFLSSCAYEYRSWKKPGANETDFNGDNYICRQEAQKRVAKTYTDLSGKKQYSSDMETDYLIYEACMKAKGWADR